MIIDDETFKEGEAIPPTQERRESRLRTQDQIFMINFVIKLQMSYITVTLWRLGQFDSHFN